MAGPVRSRLEPGETLYVSVRAVSGRRRVTGGWLQLVMGWPLFVAAGVLWLLLGLLDHPYGYPFLLVFGFFALALLCFPFAFRHTRILAFTNPNVVVIDAPTVFFPTRVVNRLSVTRPVSVARGFGWETFEVQGQLSTVDRQSACVSPRPGRYRAVPVRPPL
jgi:hypothetical protein